jgi:hypothetical protein
VVCVVRRADVNNIDIVPRNHLAPIGLGTFPAPIRRERFELLLIAVTDALHNHFMLDVKELVQLHVCVRMDPTHKAAPDQSYVKFFLHKSAPIDVCVVKGTNRDFSLAVAGTATLQIHIQPPPNLLRASSANTM